MMRTVAVVVMLAACSGQPQQAAEPAEGRQAPDAALRVVTTTDIILCAPAVGGDVCMISDVGCDGSGVVGCRETDAAACVNDVDELRAKPRMSCYATLEQCRALRSADDEPCYAVRRQ